MEKTLNQLMKELEIIAQEHRQINEFFQGDFLDAISRDSAQYPLMVATLQPGGMADGYVRVNVVLTICDKYNLQEYRQMNEVHSDCLSICNDIKTTMLQYRWTEFSDLLSEIASDPFINRGQDMVAGWTMNVAFTIYDNEDWCAIPYDDYDFENGFTPTPGGDCDPASYVVQYENGDPISSGSIASGASALIEVPNCTDPVGATLMRTGQTTVYRTGDDADTSSEGRATDFYTLASNNPFGNTNRFTDELGGQTYTDGILIDWSTYDNVAETVLGYGVNRTGNSWNNAIDNALLTTLGSYTSGWRLPNIIELISLRDFESGVAYSYSPFNISSSVSTFLLSSNSTDASNGLRIACASLAANQITTISKTTGTGNYWIPVRTFTVSGTTLT